MNHNNNNNNCHKYSHYNITDIYDSYHILEQFQKHVYPLLWCLLGQQLNKDVMNIFASRIEGGPLRLQYNQSRDTFTDSRDDRAGWVSKEG